MISTGKNKVTELKLHREHKEKATRLRSGRGNSKMMMFMVLAVVGYIVFSLTSQFNRLHSMQTNVESLQKQVKEIETRNTALREQIKQIKSDAYIEQAAREQLGLVKPGETLVVPTQSQQGADASKQQQGTAEGFEVKYKNIYD
ncbi:FtsB family cell division protein [Desulforamulus aeronauticus]|uniref:Cell division protein DivIC n=1 Tax=Desulforamulus aeronauticus DSM 10349 TaxID=1121421 RepID=A0A1M6RSK3_9FIRM|nr:septum formation initiator family protein [Desulforamulus aeronauticus]SHK35435.1 cell division protein DivIC [Desulforamulus aeronauticus DSM 10349]